MKASFQLFLISVVCFTLSCNNEELSKAHQSFTKIPSDISGLVFNNLLNEEYLKSPFNYINVYLGGGVAIGDINNDGLQDVYMTGNQTSSKLFLNKGNMRFEDITESSGTATTDWASAVTMADVNNDGWLDIYVCKSYIGEPDVRKNLLFLNNKDGSFSEVGEEMGVADENYSVAASFFDYDLDGDLDLIVGNHPRYRTVLLSIHYNYWKNPVPEFSNRLFRNDGDRFTDVTEEAGLLAYGFTLAVCTSDFTNDGLADIFITVDHDEPDLIYKNNGDGTFSNILDSAINQSSLSSMGIDAGDINHDKYPDLFVAEMLSEDHYREKVSMSMQNTDRYSYLVDTLGYKYYQMHNFMYLNNGDDTFSDVSQMSGLSKSDWTWATLFMDYNNDGWQDLFCTNGWYRDVYNRDKKQKLDEIILSLNGDMAKMNEVAEEYSRNSGQTKIKNYLFENQGNLRFKTLREESGLNDLTISTGAAYGDLDNDGDLDLIVHNLGEESFLYRNDSNNTNNYLRLKFKHHPDISAMGSRVYIYYNGDMQSRELLTTRGFQSSCEPVVHFGVGTINTIDKIEIIWPDNHLQILTDVQVNQSIELDYSDAKKLYKYVKPVKSHLVNELPALDYGLDFVHEENEFNDYDIQVLLPHKLSEYGPFSSVEDVNGDGRDDIFIGAPHKQASVLFLQDHNGKFRKSRQPIFEKHKDFEDGQSLFLDVDGDQDPDLIVGSTGYEFNGRNKEYIPRLYLNNGNGEYSYMKDALPDYNSPSSCIKSADFDNDGDPDLFIGGRLDPHRYPLPGTSALFINNGNGKFENQIDSLAPGLKNLGMIRDAIWYDFNRDGRSDLMFAGEWTDINIWINEDGKLYDRTDAFLDKKMTGWWNKIVKADLDNDGLDDFIVGNLGLNYKYKATDDKPFMVYAKDFDNSGTNDIVLGTYYDDIVYPVRGKSCSSEQIPSLGEKFDSYEKFALADIHEVYGEDLNEAVKYEVNQFASVVLYQGSDGTFKSEELPMMVQIAPVNDIIAKDLNNDNSVDLILAGNLYQSEIETGRADSGTGLILINKNNRSFDPLAVYESGLSIRGDVKSLNEIRIGNNDHILVGNNKDAIQLLSLNKR